MIALVVLALVGCFLVAGAPDRSAWSYIGAVMALGGFLAIPVFIGLGIISV
ncbi:hypothetical protein Hosp_091 [Mycobacterium phage Hosp]|uniref:hypothetical protein n=1 Tax=Mycobacterium phage 39HC TaxID=1463809 RepID=UPI0003F1D5B0|nr:hypothetical protein CG91_gp096 [Mycobacterium phage 39HC]YP_009032317.1 hypothetical protein FH38_gp91 [Mycobacterium phage Hosp]AHJ88396.1 hypothetical protein 39HC_096 [Mycobacterium phage 39HC]AHJ88496.1 hypothetical protein 40BC_096 [Mycobacterium phage 40BC]AHK12045.1 hypothetical protein Hosp_091 [Mycobacterium phage Hosp]